MPSVKYTKISGTREWSVQSVNIVLGCPHRCRYCFARSRAVDYGLCPSHDAWGTTYHRIRPAEVTKRRSRVNGRIMFPSTHDITPEFLGPCINALQRILDAGNEVLIVSKPHLESIREICLQLERWKSQVMFRFTIGSDDDCILSYWEPGAPAFAERLESLTYAHSRGWQTSVSCEPLLDAPRAVELFRKLEPYVTDSIWFGKMNDIRRRVIPGTDSAEINRIQAGQTPEAIRRIYGALKDDPKVRWKESYKAVIGLELATTAGLDI